jgi:hypothetical protein
MTMNKYERHIRDICEKNEIDLVATDKLINCGASVMNSSVRLKMPIQTHADYAVALHEIGHVKNNQLFDVFFAKMVGNGPDTLRIEAQAWQWARTNSLLWNDEMKRVVKVSYGTYVQACRMAAACNNIEKTTTPLPV